MLSLQVSLRVADQYNMAVPTTEAVTTTTGTADEAVGMMDTTDDATIPSNQNKEENTAATIEMMLPKCKVPPKEAYEPVEAVVAAAVETQQGMTGTAGGVGQSDAYRGLIDTLRSKKDLEMIRLVLLALRTSGQGKTLMYLTQSSKKHAQLIHLVVRLNPFELSEKTTVTVTDSTITATPTIDYDIADAQLQLLMAIVSANSVFLLPTITSLWKFLTSKIQEAPVERYE